MRSGRLLAGCAVVDGGRAAGADGGRDAEGGVDVMAGTVYHRNKEDKMNYKNCECKAENMIPCEGREAVRNQSMTEMVQEIKGIAADIVVIANMVNSHMFGKNVA